MISKIRLAVFLLCLLIGGCGGGTSGSGIKTYEGRVASVAGSALPGVNVTIESTGDSAVTDTLGAFVLKSDAFGAEVPFLIESPEFQNRFVLRDVEEESSRITMEVTVNTVTDEVEVNNVTVRAQFAGLCDYYFENREIIRQANRVPPGTVCSLNVQVLGDGRRLTGVPVTLQYAGCEFGAPWNGLQTVITGEGAHAGSAEINFEFKDSNEYCRYRVLVPVGAGSSSFSTYPIDTFTEQEYFGKQGHGKRSRK